MSEAPLRPRDGELYYGRLTADGPLGGSGEGEIVNLDVGFSLLRSRWRRIVLRYFYLNQQREVPLGELVEYIDNCESDFDPDAGEPDRDRIELSLHHNHLPKLESAGVVEYDRDERSVEYRRSGELEQLLQAAIDVSPVP